MNDEEDEAERKFKKMWFKLEHHIKMTEHLTPDQTDGLVYEMRRIEEEMLYEGIPRAVNLEDDLKRLEEQGLVNLDGESFSLTEKGIELMKELTDHMPEPYLDCARAAREKVEQEEEEWYRELGRTTEV